MNDDKRSSYVITLIAYLVVFGALIVLTFRQHNIMLLWKLFLTAFLMIMTLVAVYGMFANKKFGWIISMTVFGAIMFDFITFGFSRLSEYGMAAAAIGFCISFINIDGCKKYTGEEGFAPIIYHDEDKPAYQKLEEKEKPKRNPAKKKK